MSVTNVTCKIGEKEIKFETGKLALQAPGAVVVTSGETNVLVTTVANETVREGIDFFPLTVDVEERMYSAGKIPGGFFRREGRQTEKAILACRLIDRPLRPSFNDGFRCETQIIATVLSVDNENEYDVLSLNAASLGLQLAGVPLDSPVGAVRMSLINDNWVVQPTNSEMEESVFDMVIAGNLNENNDVDIVMVEAGATETAFDKIDSGSTTPTEDIVADGIDKSKEYISELIKAQAELVSQNEVPEIDWPLIEDYTPELLSELEESYKSDIETITSITDRKERSTKQAELEESAVEKYLNEEEDNSKAIKLAFKSIVKNVVRDRVISGGARLDGRTPTDIRNISAEIDLLPTVHGSSLFLRGETQVLNVTTLGMGRLEQMLDTIDTVTSKRYMHHYNFPPYSTGEAYMMRGPKRREIGHGALAEKALVPVIPTKVDFPYTIRVVSEAISSNGSTSQASVCASSLSLMAAGVPIREHVAGIAMGLISKEDNYVTLTDILGAEDALGDMDFKVAGTRNMITALQLDMKIEGLPSDVLRKALNIKPNSKVITIFTNLIWDAANVRGQIAFRDTFDCIVKSIDKYNSVDGVHILIRPHPAEYVVGTNEGYEEMLLKRYDNNLPRNVTVISNEMLVNSFSVIELTDIGVINTSTIGIEMSIEGKPTILISEPHYRSKGFTYDASSENHYFQLIDGILKNGHQLPNQIRLAKKYFYLMMFEYQHTMPFKFSSFNTFDGYNYKSFNDLKYDKNEKINLIVERISSGNFSDFIFK